MISDNGRNFVSNEKLEFVSNCPIFRRDGKKEYLDFSHKPTTTKEEYPKVQTGGKVI